MAGGGQIILLDVHAGMCDNALLACCLFFVVYFFGCINVMSERESVGFMCMRTDFVKPADSLIRAQGLCVRALYLPSRSVSIHARVISCCNERLQWLYSRCCATVLSGDLLCLDLSYAGL